MGNLAQAEIKKKKSVEEILEESLPNESLFATANKDYDPEKDEE